MARSNGPNGGLEIRVLGSFGVLRGRREVPLPPSRKTRALLAYLAIADRPQRRERLCEMFWDAPDDPRGALRWSLSKLRPILGDALDAGHDAIAVDGKSVCVDYRRVRETLATDLRQVGVSELEDLALLFRGPLLDDLSLLRCPDFEAWRVALGNDVELMQLRLRRTLIDKLTNDAPERALAHARALAALRPDDRALSVEIAALLERSRQVLSRPASVRENTSQIQPAAPPRKRVFQDMRYCTTPDGVRIAYALSGSGYPILKCANWMSHLQYEWESPIWRHWMEGLSAENQLIRYDQRGNGLSDWDVADMSFDSMVADLECVADAAGLDRFVLLGISRGCAMSVAYAARHPARVSHLVLYGGRAKGWRAQGDANEIAQRAAMLTLVRTGWGLDNPAFRRMFTSLFIPDATPEQVEWFSELQRRTISPENAARFQETSAEIDVADLLKKVTAPTLVLHGTNDAVVPFAAGREFAAGIRGARFVPLESRNHILLENEPAFAQFLDEVKRFIN
jgi:pimeloyl-ACP methyl ester carboxylesterase/DNA-binding SARP family transcriptional activator